MHSTLSHPRSRRRASLALFTVALLTFGCAGDKSATAPDGDTGLAGGLDDSAENGADTGAPPISPTWWSLDGQIAVGEDTEVDADGTSLTIGLLGLDELGEMVTVCSVTAESVALTTIDPAPDPAIFHWWSVSVAWPDGHTCSQYILPSMNDTVNLGIGELYGDIKAALGDTQFAGLHEQLYGAYVSPNKKTLWAYGVSRPTSPDATLATEAPLPADTYTLDTVYLLPL